MLQELMLHGNYTRIPSVLLKEIQVSVLSSSRGRVQDSVITAPVHRDNFLCFSIQPHYA
jgi:hypothetical protein